MSERILITKLVRNGDRADLFGRGHRWKDLTLFDLSDLADVGDGFGGGVEDVGGEHHPTVDGGNGDQLDTAALRPTLERFPLVAGDRVPIGRVTVERDGDPLRPNASVETAALRAGQTVARHHHRGGVAGRRVSGDDPDRI